MIRIQGVVVRTAVFVILCLGWAGGAWLASRPALDAFAFNWGDDLALGQHTPLSGLECQYDAANGVLNVTAHVANTTDTDDSYKIVFDAAGANGSAQVQAARVCDWNQPIKAGETDNFICTIEMQGSSAYRAIRVTAWNNRIHPTCDTGCDNAQATCLILPDMLTKLSRPEVGLLAGLALAGGLVLAVLGSVWWRRGGDRGGTIMAAVLLAAATAHALLLESVLRDYVAFAIVFVPLAVVAGVAALLMRRKDPARG